MLFIRKLEEKFVSMTNLTTLYPTESRLINEQFVEIDENQNFF